MSALDALFTPAFPVAAFACVLVALVGGLLTETGPWYHALRMPSWRPPRWAFGPAWTAIFACIALAATFAWNDAPDARTRAILVVLLGANALLNMAWSGIFFKWRRPDLAFHELVLLWFSILALVAFTRDFSGAASNLLLPYLFWVAFAGVLNHRIVVLNGPFGPAMREGV